MGGDIAVVVAVGRRLHPKECLAHAEALRELRARGGVRGEHGRCVVGVENHRHRATAKTRVGGDVGGKGGKLLTTLGAIDNGDGVAAATQQAACGGKVLAKVAVGIVTSRGNNHVVALRGGVVVDGDVGAEGA